MHRVGFDSGSGVGYCTVCGGGGGGIRGGNIYG